MKKMNLSYLSVFAFILACNQGEQSKPNAAEYHFDKDKLPALTCESGSPFFFMLVKTDAALPTFESLKVGIEPRSSDPEVESAEKAFTVRLGICQIDDDVILKQAVTFNGEEMNAMTIPESSTVEGLREVLFDQDYTKLNLNIPYETTSFPEFSFGSPSPSAGRLIVRGVEGQSLAYFLTVDGDLIDSPKILVGTFELSEDGGTGDDACSPMGLILQNNSYTIGDVTFSIDGCYAGAMKSGPKLVKIVVTDNSENLDAALRGKAIDVGMDTVQQNFNHHWACESVVIKLPHATYAMTASNAASQTGACENLPEAPHRTDHDGGLAYRFSYPGQQAVEGMFEAVNHFAPGE